MKNWLPVIFTMLVIAVLIGIGAFGMFSDAEAVTENRFVAGTLDLKVDDQDTPITMKFSVSNIAPGYDSGYLVWCLKNAGTISGRPYIEFSTITNSENGENEPESIAEGMPYARPEGELGQYLKYTIGVGPCNWSVPSLLESQWQTGPSHPWGVPGLDALSGETKFKGPTGYVFPVLNPGETYGFFLKVSLDENLRLWDGTQWIDIDDNIIQTDEIDFDIIFHMAQIS